MHRINDGRKEWIAIIKRHQALNGRYKIYICDLHFKQSDVQKFAKKCVLRKGSVPNLRYI